MVLNRGDAEPLWSANFWIWHIFTCMQIVARGPLYCSTTRKGASNQRSLRNTALINEKEKDLSVISRDAYNQTGNSNFLWAKVIVFFPSEIVHLENVVSICNQFEFTHFSFAQRQTSLTIFSHLMCFLFVQCE